MSIRVKDLPESERPYEKLELYGESKLSNAELLAIIIKTGTKTESVITIAQKILNLTGQNNLRFLQEIPIKELVKLSGIGRVKAIQLKAVCELTKRMGTPTAINHIKIKDTKDVVQLLMEELRYEKRELVKLLILDVHQKLVKILNISYGGTNFAAIEPKEILLEAIKMHANKIILVHNHPSGNARPSKLDYIVTDRIYESANILGIELLDHIIIGDGEYESLIIKTKEGKYK